MGVSSKFKGFPLIFGQILALRGTIKKVKMHFMMHFMKFKNISY